MNLIKNKYEALLADIAIRDANETEKFTMTVLGRTFSGKNARINSAY
jgi:hypothetical protein